MNQEFEQLERLDQQGNAPEGIFLNGSISYTRPCCSPITPPDVAAMMCSAANLDPHVKLKICEPCAGIGGVLKKIISESDAQNHTIYFNEIDVEKKSFLRSSFASKNVFELFPFNDDSLNDLGLYDRIIMNPPFNNVTNFIDNMMRRLNPDGVLVTLFPKYFLSRLTSCKQTILRILAQKQVTITDIDFDCGYGVRICLIRIKK
ncbi:MAG TPA: hypothetical protein VIQ51_04790 [Chryseosolibacter sp.]